MSWQVGVLNDQDINITLLGRVTSCVGTEEDDFLRLSDTKYPINNILQQIRIYLLQILLHVPPHRESGTLQ
jgi:hypothetical protein